MNRGVFSLFNWTLKRDAVLLRTHLVRGGFAGLMLLVLIVAWIQSLAVGAAGLNLFRSICWMNIIVSTLAAISYFATVVTEESEADNLGLLKLAGMGGFSILLGKSTSRLVIALMLLVVQFPFTLLAITLGGMTLLQIVAAYLSIGAHLILVANLALFFSVFCRSSGRAAAWTAVVLGAFYGSWRLLTFVGGAVQTGKLMGVIEWARVKVVIERWLASEAELSVVQRIDTVLSSNFSGPLISNHLIFSVSVAAILFVVACVGFEWSTHRQANPVRGSFSRKRFSFWRFLGVPRAWSNAMIWKEFNFLAGGRVTWWLRFILFGALYWLVCGYARSGGLTDWRLVSSTMATCVLSVLGLEFIMYACRILFDESRWGTFPLLLILPLSPRQLVSHKVLGCLFAVLPAVFWLGVAAWQYPGSLGSALSVIHIGDLEIPGPYLVVNFFLLVHLTVLLSVFVKWAALPCAVCLTLAFNSCCPVMSIGFVLGDLVGRSGGWLILLITFATYWILLFLPLQIEIVSRVEDAANHDYGS